MPISDYLEAAVLNHVLRGVTYTPPAARCVALYTSNPTDADTGTEVSGGGYARQSVTFAAPAGGAVQNTADIVFPTATAAWGTITHVGIRDAVTGGNLLFYGSLSTPKTIGVGDTFKLPVGQLVCRLD